jgi:hypothetical protein
MLSAMPARDSSLSFAGYACRLHPWNKSTMTGTTPLGLLAVVCSRVWQPPLERPRRTSSRVADHHARKDDLAAGVAGRLKRRSESQTSINGPRGSDDLRGSVDCPCRRHTRRQTRRVARHLRKVVSLYARWGHRSLVGIVAVAWCMTACSVVRRADSYPCPSSPAPQTLSELACSARQAQSCSTLTERQDHLAALDPQKVRQTTASKSQAQAPTGLRGSTRWAQCNPQPVEGENTASRAIVKHRGCAQKMKADR